ncbi:PREDICTED: serum amyloid P-component-like [Gekko japonicus]|uniref:Pentraxin family member n=1 Tax=Gekko japonicus TaxID=146911 RepID=A0ABM1KYE8_GEKJA|nr:PREDICTED: serum amyloid P-component-like [Gekko japonicus]
MAPLNICLPASIKHRYADLRGRAFIFPQDGVEAHVTLKAAQEEPLRNFTICLRSFTNLIQDCPLFSYASKDQYRDILIYKTYRNGYPEYNVWIGGEEVDFRVPDSFLGWKSSCITWESEMGVITLGIGNFVLARRVVQKGHCIGPPAVIMLGEVVWQTADEVDFSGEIKDVYMWNATIPMRDLRRTSWDSLSPSPIINWRNLQYEIKGNVTLV